MAIEPTVEPARSNKFFPIIVFITIATVLGILLFLNRSIPTTTNPEATLHVQSEPITEIPIQRVDGTTKPTNYSIESSPKPIEEVLIAPTQYQYFVFVNWTGCNEAINEKCVVTVEPDTSKTASSNKTVTAHYRADPSRAAFLTVSSAPTTVNSIAGFDTTSGCFYMVRGECKTTEWQMASTGRTLTTTLTAPATSGAYQFKNWSSNCIKIRGSKCTVNVAVGESKNIVATYAEPASNNAVLHVRSVPNTGISGFKSSSGCYETYDGKCEITDWAMKNVSGPINTTLTAPEVPGFDFSYWDGCPTPPEDQKNSCEISVENGQNKIVTANYAYSKGAVLHINSSPIVSANTYPEHGCFTTTRGECGVTNSTMSNPNEFSNYFHAQQKVGKHYFTSWTGCDHSDGSGYCHVALGGDQEKTIVANYSNEQFPDLLSRQPSVSNNFPQVGQVIAFRSSIVNYGNAMATFSTARFCVDNPDCLTTNDGLLSQSGIGRLKRGSSQNIFSSWIGKEGGHTIYVCADVSTKVAESDETNNCSAIPIFVNQNFDYRIENSGDITIIKKKNQTSGENKITLTKTQGITRAVSLSASGLPRGASASFKPGSCTPDNTCSSTETISISSRTKAADSTIKVTGTSPNHSTNFKLTVIDGHLSCTTATSTSITIAYDFTNGANNSVSLFRENTLLQTFSGRSHSKSVLTDPDRNPNTTYTYSLRNGTANDSTSIVSTQCKTRSTDPEPTPPPPPATPISGSTSCDSSKSDSITVSYAWKDNASDLIIYLFRGATKLLPPLGPESSKSDSYTDPNLESGVEHAYHLAYQKKNNTGAAFTTLGNTSTCSTK